MPLKKPEECPCAPPISHPIRSIGYSGFFQNAEQIDIGYEMRPGVHEYRSRKLNDTCRVYYCIWCLDEINPLDIKNA